MNGLKIAPMKPVTTLVMMPSGPDGTNAVGGASACVVAADCGAVVAVWVVDDLDDACTGVVLVIADWVVTGVDRRVVLATI